MHRMCSQLHHVAAEHATGLFAWWLGAGPRPALARLQHLWRYSRCRRRHCASVDVAVRCCRQWCIGCGAGSRGCRGQHDRCSVAGRRFCQRERRRAYDRGVGTLTVLRRACQAKRAAAACGRIGTSMLALKSLPTGDAVHGRCAPGMRHTYAVMSTGRLAPGRSQSGVLRSQRSGAARGGPCVRGPARPDPGRRFRAAACGDDTAELLLCCAAARQGLRPQPACEATAGPARRRRLRERAVHAVAPHRRSQRRGCCHERAPDHQLQCDPAAERGWQRCQPRNPPTCRSHEFWCERWYFSAVRISALLWPPASGCGVAGICERLLSLRHAGRAAHCVRGS